MQCPRSIKIFPPWMVLISIHILCISAIVDNVPFPPPSDSSRKFGPRVRRAGVWRSRPSSRPAGDVPPHCRRRTAAGSACCPSATSHRTRWCVLRVADMLTKWDNTRHLQIYFKICYAGRPFKMKIRKTNWEGRLTACLLQSLTSVLQEISHCLLVWTM